ncbi:uncharacterized protein (DUF2252 family) [Haloactinopolyspora alba]|uniref:Uncharacterized protein (DUF2252 family) n=1 Tax=Haloactinopolyspora alba TaxID=648780 RepID=A0A2P8DZ69_9ACTN|nr:DUF2252 domain-containing protein [Haloactinopolyspora alba]PSL02514.1 uncharacterized protein (DUF2252 family) [Haloactinopolyspora alba]
MSVAESLHTTDDDARRRMIVATLADAFAELMTAAPEAFRIKFRKMAADPFAFYRGSAALFYADVSRLHDPWVDERTSRVWIQGDLHAENFGTYMDGEGMLIFDVNDFDESYVGHYTWDVQRLAASIALMCWRKAIADSEIDRLVARYARAYLDQVHRFTRTGADHEFALRLDNTDGPIHEVLLDSRLSSRVALLDGVTETEGYERIFRAGHGVRRLDENERARVYAAFEKYLDTIPADKRLPDTAFAVKDVVGRSGFGIGSAGLPAYNVLVEGVNQALDNDIVISMKQGNVAAPSRVVTDPEIASYFRHHGHRTAVSQRALQAHADRLLGSTDIDGVGYVVSELSPYVRDLEWDAISEPADIAPVLEYLGRATAKIHCVADADSDQNLVAFQTEEAIEHCIQGRDDEFVEWLCTFAREYADVVRDDHRRFVDAFRHDEIPGVRATARSA